MDITDKIILLIGAFFSGIMFSDEEIRIKIMGIILIGLLLIYLGVSI